MCDADPKCTCDGRGVKCGILIQSALVMEGGEMWDNVKNALVMDGGDNCGTRIKNALVMEGDQLRDTDQKCTCDAEGFWDIDQNLF